MSLEQTFLADIQENPDDDTPRLVYADWLSEQEDVAQRDRGEFIRVQCQLAKMTEDDPTRAPLSAREEELLARYQVEWTDRAFVRWLKHPKKACKNPQGHRFCQLIARGLAADKDREALPEGHPDRKRL